MRFTQLTLILFICLTSISCKRTDIITSSDSKEEPQQSEDTVRKDLTKADYIPVLHDSKEIRALTKVLHNLNLISNNSYFDILTAIEDSTLKSDFQLISYLKESQALKYQDYEKYTPEEYYRKIYDTLAGFAGISPVQINTITETDTFPDEGITERKVNVSLKWRDYTLLSENKVYTDSISSYGWIDESFHSVLNDILARKKEEERIYLWRKENYLDFGTEEYSRMTDYSVYGFVLLNENQARHLRPYLHIINLSTEDHTPLLTKDEIETYTEKFIRKNLIGKDAKEDFSGNERIAWPYEILKKSSSANCFYTSTDTSYSAVLEELKLMSDENFSAEKLQRKTSSPYQTELTFNFKDKEHNLQISSSPGTVNFPSLVEETNTILNSTSEDGNFYLLEDNDGYCYIFLTEKQVEDMNSITAIH